MGHMQRVGEGPTNTDGLIQWHVHEAEAAEREAETAVALRRQRLLGAARYHRDCAELAREELL